MEKVIIMKTLDSGLVSETGINWESSYDTFLAVFPLLVSFIMVVILLYIVSLYIKTIESMR